MIVRMFEVTEPAMVKQYNQILTVAYKMDKGIEIAYQSNWNVVLLCPDIYVARTLVAKLKRKQDWVTETRSGKQIETNQYVQVKFIRG
jgi:hypothetical protein